MFPTINDPLTAITYKIFEKYNKLDIYKKFFSDVVLRHYTSTSAIRLRLCKVIDVCDILTIKEKEECCSFIRVYITDITFTCIWSQTIDMANQIILKK